MRYLLCMIVGFAAGFSVAFFSAKSVFSEQDQAVKTMLVEEGHATWSQEGPGEPVFRLNKIPSE